MFFRYNVIDNTERVGNIIFNINKESQSSSDIGKNIISSPVLMKSYVNTIFNNCSNIGYVKFSRDEGTTGFAFAMTDLNILAVIKCSLDQKDLTNRVSEIMDGVCAYVIPDF
jgi:hypothetical protein